MNLMAVTFVEIVNWQDFDFNTGRWNKVLNLNCRQFPVWTRKLLVVFSRQLSIIIYDWHLTPYLPTCHLFSCRDTSILTFIEHMHEIFHGLILLKKTKHFSLNVLSETMTIVWNFVKLYTNFPLPFCQLLRMFGCRNQTFYCGG